MSSHTGCTYFFPLIENKVSVSLALLYHAEDQKGGGCEELQAVTREKFFSNTYMTLHTLEIQNKCLRNTCHQMQRWVKQGTHHNPKELKVIAEQFLLCLRTQWWATLTLASIVQRGGSCRWSRRRGGRDWPWHTHTHLLHIPSLILHLPLPPSTPRFTPTLHHLCALNPTLIAPISRHLPPSFLPSLHMPFTYSSMP